MFQTKEQDKSPGTNLNEMKVSDLSDTVFKAHIKMLAEVGKQMQE